MAYGKGFGVIWSSEADLYDWIHFVPFFCLFWAALCDSPTWGDRESRNQNTGLWIRRYSQPDSSEKSIFSGTALSDCPCSEVYLQILKKETLAPEDIELGGIVPFSLLDCFQLSSLF